MSYSIYPIKMVYSLYKREFSDCKIDRSYPYDKWKKEVIVLVPEERAKNLRPRWHFSYKIGGYTYYDYVNAKWNNDYNAVQRKLKKIEKGWNEKPVLLDIDIIPSYTGGNYSRT